MLKENISVLCREMQLRCKTGKLNLIQLFHHITAVYVSSSSSLVCFDLVSDLRASPERSLYRCDQLISVTDPVRWRNCSLPIINLCNKPYR